MDLRKASKVQSGSTAGFTPTGTLVKEGDKPMPTQHAAPVLTSPTTDTLVSNAPSDISEYVTYAQQNGFTMSDIQDILDSLIVSGTVCYNWLLFNKVPVVFEVRPAWVHDYVLGKMETDMPHSAARFSDMLSAYNLAASLREYNGTQFKLETEEDLENAYTAVMSLPYPVQAQLIKKLAAFDRAVAVAVSDWMLENFTSRSQAE